jgi:hypothetical protein
MGDGAPYFEGDLDAGTYNIVVTTEVPGETGEYTLVTQTGRRSWVGGRLGAGFGYESWSADLPGSATGAFTGSVPTLRVMLGGVGGATVAEHFNFIGEIMAGDVYTAYEAGARLYVLGRRSALRPFAQYTYGGRNILEPTTSFADNNWDSTGGTLGFGVEWFLRNPQLGLEAAMLTHSGEFDDNGTKSDGTLTRFRVGFNMRFSKPRPPE